MRNRFACRPVAAAAVIFTGLTLAACSVMPQPDNAAIVQAFRKHQSDVEVTAKGVVTQLLPDASGASGPHERFIIRLDSQSLTLLIDHDLSIAPRVPVAIGDEVIVHGEYIWNAQGGLVHFTHHDPQGTHTGGFIELGGKVYS